MKVQNITDIDKFFAKIDECVGAVELLTPEGDRLNLKSNLCKYISLAKIFSDGKIKEVEIICHEPADVDKLVQYLIMG